MSGVALGVAETGLGVVVGLGQGVAFATQQGADVLREHSTPVAPTEDSFVLRKLGFTARASQQNGFGWRGLETISFLRVAVADVRNLARIPIAFMTVVFDFVAFVLQFIFSLLIFAIFFLLLLYFVQIYWPTVIEFLVVVVTPFVNVIIQVFNFVVTLIIIILRILFQIWNMFVPFIGMILYVVIDITVTVFRAVFDILGSVNIMPIISAILEVMFMLVDVYLQVMMVFIEVGMSILQVLVDVISFVMELLMYALKVWVDILVWVIDFLFRIMEPILLAVQALVSAFSWMLSAKSTAMSFSSRKLLSLGMAVTLSGAGIHTYESASPPIAEAAPPEDYEDFISGAYQRYRSHISTINGTDSARLLQDNYNMGALRPEFGEEALQRDIERRKNAGAQSFHVSRRLFDDQAGTRRLRPAFAGTTRAPNENDEVTSHLDKTTHTFMHHFHTGVHTLAKEQTDFNAMHESMARIRAHWRGTDRLSMQSVLKRFNEKNPQLARMPKGPGHVRYTQDPEHPRDMHVRFHGERQNYKQKHGLPASFVADMSKYRSAGGRRKILSSPGHKAAAHWDDSERVHAEHLDRLQRRHAKEIVEQEQRFFTHHEERIRTARVIHHSLRTVLHKHASTTLHPDNLAKHGSRILEQFGYESPWEVYHHFIETHSDAESFVMSLSSFIEHPLMQFWAEKDERADTHRFFHTWAEEQKLLDEQRGFATGRKLLQTRQSTKGSKDKVSGLELVTKTDCDSDPRNPLCMPVISENFKPKLSTIKWPDQITKDADVCPPWRNTRCLFCWARVLNAFQDVRFVISGFPPFNFALTTFTILVPWMAWSVNWVFLVDRGELATLRQVLCFLIYIYDFLVTAIVAWLLYKFVWPLVVAVYGFTYGNCLAYNSYKTQQESAWEAEADNDPAFEKAARAAMLYARTNSYRGGAMTRFPMQSITNNFYGMHQQQRLGDELRRPGESISDAYVRHMQIVTGAHVERKVAHHRAEALFRMLNDQFAAGTQALTPVQSQHAIATIQESINTRASTELMAV